MLATDELWEFLISANLKPRMTNLVLLLAGMRGGQEKWLKTYTILHACPVLFHRVHARVASQCGILTTW